MTMEQAALPGELAAQILRVADVRAHYRVMQNIIPLAHNLAPAIWMITQSLDAAVSAAGSSDIAQQRRAVEDLRGYGP